MATEKSSDTAANIKGFAAGTVSGTTKLVIGHPFDTIKLRTQVSPTELYAGPLECFVKTIKLEGFRALYKGATPPLFGWALSDSLLMGSMNSYRGIIADWEAGRAGIVSRGRDSLTLPGHFMAATLAGWTVCTIVTPVELLKAKLQMQTHSHVKQFTGPIDCARQIVRARGVPGLWHAFPATLAFRTWFGSMFLSYEIFLRQFKKRNVSPGTANFWSGGLAAIVFWTLSFPFDVIKNRQMSDSITQPRYKGWVDTARQTWQDGKMKSFYRGFAPCLLRAVPTNAAAIFAWETTMRLLEKV